MKKKKKWIPESLYERLFPDLGMALLTPSGPMPQNGVVATYLEAARELYQAGASDLEFKTGFGTLKATISVPVERSYYLPTGLAKIIVKELQNVPFGPVFYNPVTSCELSLPWLIDRKKAISNLGQIAEIIQTTRRKQYEWLHKKAT